MFLLLRKWTRHDAFWVWHTAQNQLKKTILLDLFGCYEKRVRHHANARKDVPYSVAQLVSDKYRASVRVRFHNVVAFVFTRSSRAQRTYARMRAQRIFFAEPGARTKFLGKCCARVFA